MFVLLFLSFTVTMSVAGQGELIITASQKGAEVFIGGEKVAVLGDDAKTVLQVVSGDVEVELKKLSANGEEFFSAKRTVFVGKNSSTKYHFELISSLTQKRLAKATLYDEKTNLTWMRCSLGQSWNGKTCTGKAGKYNWTEAKRLAKNKTYAGHSNWRLPTRMELHSIVYCSKGRRGIKLAFNGKKTAINGKDQNGRCLGKNYQRPTINTRKFPNTPAYFYWSSSPYAHYSHVAWGVHFDNGNDDDDYLYHRRHVRLVRSGQ